MTDKSKAKKPSGDLLTLVLVATGLVALSLLSWSLVQKVDNRFVERLVEEKLSRVHHRIAADLGKNATAIRRMAMRWERRLGGTPNQEWKVDAQFYVADLPGLRSLAWVDSSLKAQWMVSDGDFSSEKNDDLKTNPAQFQALAEAKGSRSPVVTGVVELNTKEIGFYLFDPLFTDKGKFLGTLRGTLSYVSVIETMTKDLELDGTQLEILVDGQPAFVTKTGEPPLGGQWQKQVNSDILNHTWAVILRPTQSFVSNHKSIVPPIVLIAGLVISALMTLITHLAIRSRQRARDLDQLLQVISQSEKQFQSIIQHASNPMIVVDEGGKINLVNRAAVELFGYSEAEMVGEAIELLVPEQFRPQHIEIRANFMKKPSPIRMGDGRLVFGVNKQGSEIPLDIGLTPFTREGKGFVVSTIIDLTEIRAAQLKIESINGLLKSSVQELEEYTYIVSHDLQAPLVSLSAFSSKLGASLTNLDEKQQKWLERIQVNISVMQQLVRDLLQLSRVQRQQVEIGECNLNEVFQEISGTFEIQAQEKGVTLIIPEGMPTVLAHSSRLTQVFTNLISNALKYMGPVANPKVQVGIGETSADQVVIYVKDNGQGIAPEYHNKIFKIFERLNPRESDGTGLGLSICRNIIAKLGGEIWVESEVNQGATFFVKLKLATQKFNFQGDSHEPPDNSNSIG